MPAKKTAKYVNALKTVKALPSGSKALVPARTTDRDHIYLALERNGYRWDSKSGAWSKFETPDNAISTGTVDIRIRAALGDVEHATGLIGQALEAAGVKFTRVSAPDPDDRDGPTVTARVYMSIVLPGRS